MTKSLKLGDQPRSINNCNCVIGSRRALRHEVNEHSELISASENTDQVRIISLQLFPYKPARRLLYFILPNRPPRNDDASITDSIGLSSF